jgi:acetoacetyl-CoA synthetase
MSTPLWTPEKTRAAQTTLGAFSGWMSSRAGKSFAGYDDLHRTSIAATAVFWSALWGSTSVLEDNGNLPLLVDTCKMPGPGPFSAHA